MKKQILLRGEGANQHVLYGEFKVDKKEDFTPIEVKKESVLKHEQPDGSFAEHKSLKIEDGSWVMGKQVEYNPFNNEISQVWD